MSSKKIERDAAQTTLLLVRHGQTEWNASGRFLGRTDVPLDDTGRAQAARLAKALEGRFDAVYTSPAARARETARAITPDAVPVEGLQELNQGELEGLSFDEALPRFAEFFAAWARDPAVARVPGGETLAACQARVLSAVLEIARTHHPGGVVVVVAHQLAIASALCAIRGSSLVAWRENRLPNCGASALKFDGQRLNIDESNQTVDNLRVLTGSALPDV